eukprot:735252-Alexandrium_andersonii.AAC.2
MQSGTWNEIERSGPNTKNSELCRFGVPRNRYSQTSELPGLRTPKARSSQFSQLLGGDRRLSLIHI